MKDESKKHIIIKEFFDRGIWRDLEKCAYLPFTLAPWTPLSAH
jgi:hypothetical protein